MKCQLIPYAISSNKDPETFRYMLKDPFHNFFMLDLHKGGNSDLPIEEDLVCEDMRLVREHGKVAMLSVGRYIFEKNDEPYHAPLKANWREIMDKIDELMTELGGEAFIGYSFDEPFYYMRGDEYLEMTKYISKYGRRIFAIHASVHIHMALWPVNESHDFKSVAFRNMSHITPENHAYTTDVSYDYYGEWEHGVHHNTVYRLFIERMGDRFEKTRFWFTPPIGTVMRSWVDIPSEKCEQICIDIFMGMWNWAKSVENFGGFIIYTYLNYICRDGSSHGNARAYLIPDENGKVKWEKMYAILQAVGKGFDEGKHPSEIELPEVEYDKGYIV